MTRNVWLYVTLAAFLSLSALGGGYLFVCDLLSIDPDQRALGVACGCVGRGCHIGIANCRSADDWFCSPGAVDVANPSSRAGWSPYSSTAPSALSTAFCATLIPVTPLMFIPA
jgi:hypothetical protein